MIKYLLYLTSLVVLMGITRPLEAQTMKVKGTVIDNDTKEALPGVTIKLKEGKKVKGIGVTNNNGKFSLTLSSGNILEFSFIGYDNSYLTISHDKENYTVNMSVSVKAMKEAVIVGYQKKSRETVTGAVTTISGKEIQDVPVDNFVSLLQGKVAGLNIQNNNGTPGMMGTIQIRGLSSINIQGSGDNAYLTPTSPLFVIDGIPVDIDEGFQYGFEQAGPGISPLSLIPPQDIASISVLKDAMATSLYGSKGAYGVILITTKRGNSKVPIVRFSSQFSVSVPPPLRKVIGGRGERMLRIKQILDWDTSYAHALDEINYTSFLSDSLNPYYNNSTDWQDFFYRVTYNQSHNLSVSGGTDKFNYSVNGNYHVNNGIIKNTWFKRYALSMNTQYRPSPKFKLFAKINASLGNNSKGSGNSLAQTGVADAGSSSSLLPPPSLFTATNATLAAAEVEDNNKTAKVSTNLSVDYELLEGLRLSTTFGYTYSTGTERKFEPSILHGGYASNMSYNSIGTSLYSRSSISYFKNMGDHNLSLHVSNEISYGESKEAKLGYQGTPNDQIQGPTGYEWSSLGGYSKFSQSKSVGLSGSLSYNYKEKYVISFNYRKDASSTNGPRVPWTDNPSIGVRWNLSKESFMEQFSSWLDYAGLRGSWGRNVRPNGDIYDIYGRYSTDAVWYNNRPTISISLGALPNASLVPSTTTQWNGGFDAGFFDSKFSLGLDLYYKQADKQLRSKPIANINGFEAINTNETSLVDYGWGLSITLHPLPETSKLKWSISANTSKNKNILTHLPNGVRQLQLEFQNGNKEQPIIHRIGSNAISNLLYHYKGIYTSDAQVPVDPVTGYRYRADGSSGNLIDGIFFRAGDPIWTDRNGNYKLDPGDLVIAGDPEPRFTGGISSLLQYGNFSLRISTSITIMRDIQNNALADRLANFANPYALRTLVPLSGYDIWQKTGQTAIYPNPYDFTRYSLYSPFRLNQTLFLEDGSYFKINSITLSYNLDRNFTERYGITSMRFHISANNIHTFSNYAGPNPEMVTSVGRDTPGGYPPGRDFTIGLGIQF